MKFLLVQNATYIPTFGGANKSNRLVLEALAARGHSCLALTTATPVQGFRSQSAFLRELEIRGVHPSRVFSGGVVFHHQNVEIHAVTDISRIHAHLKDQIQRFDPTWVLVSSEDPGQLLLEKALEAAPSRVVYIARTTMALPFGPGCASSSQLKTELVREAAGIIAISSYLKDYIWRWSGCESVVLPLQFYGLGPFSNYNNFDHGFITMINPCAVKGISIFLALARQLPLIQFAAVPTWGTCRTDLTALKELPNVKIMHPVDEVDEIFARTRVILVPSLWAEAKGRIPIEAMLRGIPVLASDVGGIKESMLGMDYILPVSAIERYEESLDDRMIPIPKVPPQDIGPWLKALQTLISDRERYDQLSIASRAAALRHVSDLSITPLEEYFHSLDLVAKNNAGNGSRAMKTETKRPEQTIISDSLGKLSADKRALLMLQLRKKRKNIHKTQEIPRVPRNVTFTYFPLSYAQRRLWFLSQLEPDSSTYNSVQTVTFRGQLDVPTLCRSLNEIIRRHEILRTTFTMINGQPAQIVNPYTRTRIPIIDLQGVGKTKTLEEIERLVNEERRQIFDLSQGPLLRIKLLHKAPREYLLILTIHHIVSDGWSLGIFIREMNTLYEAFTSGRPSPLQELSIQYGDFTNWEQERLRGDLLASHLTFWKQQMNGAPAILELPISKIRPPAQSYNGAAETLILPPDLSFQLEALSLREDVTLFMTLLAAFKALLARYTWQEDIIIGTTVAGRTLAEVEKLIGFFVNILVLRTNLSGAPRFIELLKRVREVCLGAYAHQDLPFEKLVEELEPARNLAYSPLIQVMFNLRNLGSNQFSIPGLKITQIAQPEPITNFDLILNTSKRRGRLTVTFVYNTDVLEREAVNRLAKHYCNLLAAVINDPGRRLSVLPLLTEAEEHQLLYEWNQTAKEYRSEKCIHQLFEEQAERTPESIALVYEDQQVNYRELNARANQLARYLRRLGVGPEILVGICTERCLEMVVGLLAILKAGGAYVPLDPAYPVERIALMLEDAEVKVLLTEQQLLEGLPASGARVVTLDAEWRMIAAEDKENLLSRAKAENLAYVIYTSGSTGRPKGVSVPHQQASNFFTAMDAYLEPDPSAVWLAVTGISFDISVLELLWTLARGFRVVVQGEWGSHQPVNEPDGNLAEREKKKRAARGGDFSAVSHIIRHQVSHLQCTPSRAKMLSLEADSISALSSIRKLLIGGEAFPMGLADDLNQLMTAEIRNMYGPTETTVWSATYPLHGEESSIPIGRPIANTQAYILDRELNVVPVGVPGELYIGGNGVVRGYLKQPGLTVERFLPDRFSQKIGTRLYWTGDLARYLADGNIEFLGRIDYQVKIRGFRIELAEIEVQLSSHPTVRECVVIAREEAPGEKRLVAYLIGNPEQAPSASELKHFLKERLPEYLVPSAFMALDEFPLTPNGKVDRRALPAPESPRRESDENYQAPRNPVEEILAGIWSEVLRLERLGTDDNFFELGGDSILSIQIIARARQAGLDLTPKHIFQHQTIAQLAQVITAASEQRALTDQAPVSGELPLTPIQQWFFAQQPTEPDHYNQSVLLRVETELEIEFLARIVRELLSHHDGLRLRFAHTAQGWRQFNAAVELNQVFSIIDLAAAAPERQSGLIEGAAEQAQRSLNLSEGPLARVIYFDCGRGRAGRLLMVIHHLAVDGVSWRILLEDLQRGYEQWRAGQSVRLPAKTSSFKQWAERMRAEVEAGLFDHELSYWTRMLPVKPLPVDHRGGAVHLVETRQAVVSQLSREQTQALLQEAPGVYHTRINEVLLTCLAQVLSQWTGARRVMVDLEGHGREQVEALEGSVDVSRTVGWFTTIFPVALELGAAGSGIGDELKRVKEQLRAIPGRGIGHGWLRYARSGEAGERMRRMAEAEVSFNYLGQVDQVLEPGGIFSEAGESGGATRSKKGKRSHQLEITAIVKGGRLVLQWIYSPEAHERRTIEELAGRFEEAVERVIEHCREPEAGGYTPSDFPLARLTQEEVDRLVKAEREVEGIYRLSPLQQGLLFHTLYEPGSGQYFERTSCLLRGLEVGAFQKAWATVVKRHPALRTSFHWEGLNETVQVVHRRVDLPWEEGDWRELSDAERRERLKRHLEEDRQRGFRLDQAPLMRMGLMRVDEEGYYFIWSHHHVLLDGWSAALVIKEVFVYYEAYRQGREMELEQPRAYSDYIEWLERQDREKAESYWRRALKGFQTPTALRVADNRRASGGYQSQRITLSEGMSERLRAVARGHQLTLNTLAQGAWAVLLSRYSGEEDVVFGATVSGRESGLTGIESMVGVFINTLPVRVRVRGGREVSGLLKQLQEEQAEARQYEYSSLAEVQKWSETVVGERLFESLLAYENYPVDRAMLEEARQGRVLEVREVRGEERTNYPLTVVAWAGQRMELRLTYQERRYDEVVMGRMAGHLRRLLEGLGEEAEQKVSELRMLSAEEEHQLCFEWNQTAREYPFEKCIHQLFEEQVEIAPDAIAVVYEVEQVSYSELDRRANQLARYLVERRVGPEALIGICMERSTEMILGILGILKAGGAYVPIDPDCPRQRLKTIVTDSQAHLLLTQRHLLEDQSEVTTRVIYLVSDWDQISLQDSSNTNVAVSPDNAAYVIYTSGSTGQPKGVIITHYNIVRLLYGTNPLFQFDRNDVWTLLHSYTFDFSVWEMWGALAYGGRLIVAPKWVSQSSEAISVLLDKEQVSILNQTPTAFRGLAKIKGEKGQMVGRSLRQIIFGGEAMDAASVEEWIESRGSESPLLVNMYGITETTVHVTYWLAIGDELRRGRSSIGRAIADLRVYILDRHLGLTPVGVSEEIYVGGGGVARGYLKQEDLTGERFTPDPYSMKGGARLYKTGDLGRYKADGEIEYIGRIDNQVKVRGYRIELGEVEATLKQHSAIRDVLVLATDDGTEHKRLVAYILIHNDALPKEQELRKYLMERLPEYMVPATYVKLEQLPLTPNGKVDKKALPQPEMAGRELEESYREPRTEVEEVMVGIWRQVLRVERVGADDNFFELGGHSLLATRVISRIREVFKVELALRAIFEEERLADLSRRVEAELRAGLQIPPIERVSRVGSLPLSFAQQRLWFIDQLEPGGAMYNVPTALRVRGELRRELLEGALGEVVRRHEVLRTRIEVEAGVPVQVIEEWECRGSECIDLTSLAKEEREAEAKRIAKEEAERGFDLRQGPLLRIKALKLEKDEHVVLFTMHHIISDGWSMGVLVREVCALCEAMSQGKASPLPELEIQYADYAEWQWEYLKGEILEQQLRYWKQQLQGAPAVLELPTDRSRPPVQSYRGDRQSLALSAELSAKLKDFSRHQDVTLFMTLLAAFQALLYRYSWQEDILVGTGIASRNRKETEHLIGFFVNMLVLRTNLSGDPTFSELLARVREVTLGAFTHQDVPFELLVEKLQPERDLRRTPLFQVVFVLQNVSAPTLELPGLSLSPMKINSEMTHFDLTMSMGESPEGLIGVLEYNTDLFESATIIRMLKNYAALLEAVVAHPEQRVLDAPLHLGDENYFATPLNLQSKHIENILETEKFHF